MDKRLQVSVGVLLLLLVIFASGSLIRLAYAADNTKSGSDASTDALIQKGLTIAEVDRELARLKAEDAVFGARIADNERQLATQDKLAAEKRKHAGSVLRAYYMGERDSIWLLLFSLRSFQDVLKTFEYLHMIVESDHRKLSDYIAAMNDMKQLQANLSASRGKLQQSEADYAAQRERLVKLQQELDKQLAGNSDSQTVVKRIEEVTATWQQRGIPLFRKYFDALAEAMKGLPEIAAQGGSEGRAHLILDGLNAAFVITDSELNDFLRAKNPLFNDLTFRFVKDGVTAGGKSGDLTLTIDGLYELDPNKKTIGFHVKRLTFNGYELPDTTVRDLERQVDLSFNPKAYMTFLEPTEVKQEDGQLTVRMKINL